MLIPQAGLLGPQRVHLQFGSSPLPGPQWPLDRIPWPPSRLFSLPSSHVCPNLPTFRCFSADLSDMFVCCLGNLLLNDSCSSCCTFKGRYQGPAPLTLPCFWYHPDLYNSWQIRCLHLYLQLGSAIAAFIFFLLFWWGQFLLLLALVVLSGWLLKIIMRRIRITVSHSRMGLHHAFWGVECISFPPLQMTDKDIFWVVSCWCWYLHVCLSSLLVRSVHSVEFWKQCEGRREPWEVGKSDMEVLRRWEIRPVVSWRGEKKKSSAGQSHPCYFYFVESVSLKLSWVTL